MATPKLQEITIEYAHDFDSVLLPKSQYHLCSPVQTETQEFDPGWRLCFSSRRRVNGFHDYDTAYDKGWTNGSVIGFQLNSSSDLCVDSSFLRLSITMSQHARTDNPPVWKMTHTIMNRDLQLDTCNAFTTLCEKETTYSLVEYPIISASFKVTMPFQMKSDIYPDNFSTNAMIKRFLFKSMVGEPTFVDTRYFVFSHRTGTRVHTPRVVFGNSYILKASSEYFEAAFRDNSFLESKETDLSGPYPELEQDYTNDYGYASDSDLDDEDEDEYSISSDSPSTSPVSFKSPALRVPKHLRGKTMIIRDFAYRTFQSFIFYICTGEVAFEPLSSDSLTRSKERYRMQRIIDHPEAPFSCSAKSMYRLADKLGVESLQNLALQHIKSEISERTIFSELFCEFTSRYPEVQKIEMDFFLAHYDSLKSTEEFEMAVSGLILNHQSRAELLLIPLLAKMSAAPSDI